MFVCYFFPFFSTIFYFFAPFCSVYLIAELINFRFLRKYTEKFKFLFAIIYGERTDYRLLFFALFFGFVFALSLSLSLSLSISMEKIGFHRWCSSCLFFSFPLISNAKHSQDVSVSILFFALNLKLCHYSFHRSFRR